MTPACALALLLLASDSEPTKGSQGIKLAQHQNTIERHCTRVPLPANCVPSPPGEEAGLFTPPRPSPSVPRPTPSPRQATTTAPAPTSPWYRALWPAAAAGLEDSKPKDTAPALEPNAEPGRPECAPVPVPHMGGDALHDLCADGVPLNVFAGSDVLVNGKRFDALQPARVLWEVKTDNFDTYPPDLREIVVESQVEKLRHERALALACRFDFRVGVRSPAHKVALELADPELKGLIEVMEWC